LNLESGCLAVTVKSTVLENIGKTVTVLEFLGEVRGYIGCDRWTTDAAVLDSCGGSVFHQRECNLMRIDGGTFNSNDNEIYKIKDKKVLI